MKTHRDSPSLPYLLVTGALILGVMYLMIYQVGRPLWLDDTHSTFHAFHGPGSIVQNLRTDSHPPLYFWLLSSWMGIVGVGEIALRVPSIVFYLLTGLALYLFGRGSFGPWASPESERVSGWTTDGPALGSKHLYGPEVGVLFAVFFLFNPVAFQHAHGVRMYALLGLLSGISTVLFLLLSNPRRKEGKRSTVLFFILTNVLGTFTHYWFFFLLAGQFVGGILFSKKSERLVTALAILASGAPFALLWSPVLLDQMQGNPTGWMVVPGGLWLVRAPLQLLGGWDPWDFERLAMGFYLLFAITCFVRLRSAGIGRITKRELSAALGDRSLWLLLTIPVVVMVLAFFVSQVRPVYHVKYTIVTIPAVAMVFGSTLSRLGERRLVPVLALVFIGGACFSRGPSLTGELDRNDRASAQYVIDHAEPGDELIHITLNYAPITHYLRALAPQQTFSQTVFPDEVRDHVGWRDRDGMVRDSLSLRREAREVTRSWIEGGGTERLWFFATLPTRDGSELTPDSIFSGMLMEEIDKGFRLEETIPIRGWWHREIRLYVRR